MTIKPRRIRCSRGQQLATMGTATGARILIGKSERRELPQSRPHAGSVHIYIHMYVPLLTEYSAGTSLEKPVRRRASQSRFAARILSGTHGLFIQSEEKLMRPAKEKKLIRCGRGGRGGGVCVCVWVAERRRGRYVPVRKLYAWQLAAPDDAHLPCFAR